MSDAVLDVVFKHLEKNGALEKVLEENGTLEKVLARGEEKKAREIALEMLRDGFAPEKISLYVKMPLEWVQGLAQ